MRSFHLRVVISAALVALLPLVTPDIVRAQATDSATALAGAMRIDFNAGAWLAPGPSHSYSVSTEFDSFVSEHWQVGIGPSFAVSTGPYGNAAGLGLVGMANYVLGTGRTRWFLGATAGGSGNSGGGGRSFFGAQTGALYFLVPTAALRAELASRQVGGGGGRASYGFALALDSYLPATRGGMTTAPELGAVDVALDAGMNFNLDRSRSVNLMFAPFLAQWAQVGGYYSAISSPSNGNWPTSQQFRGFGRLYAPLGPRAMPFLEGFAETARYPYGVRTPNILGATAGLRHYLNNGVALDAGLQWRHAQTLPMSGYSVPGRDFLMLQAGLVSELRLRASQQ